MAALTALLRAEITATRPPARPRLSPTIESDLTGRTRNTGLAGRA